MNDGIAAGKALAMTSKMSVTGRKSQVEGKCSIRAGARKDKIWDLKNKAAVQKYISRMRIPYR
jgi:hypothetical protein